jgi:hypothetical protein
MSETGAWDRRCAFFAVMQDIFTRIVLRSA